MTQPAPGVGGPTDETDPDHTGRFVRQPNGRMRPLSPHLQVWRFHLTMAGSILNRVAAGALGAQAQPSAQSAGLQHMKVTLHESHVAWASYEGRLPA